MFKFYIHYFQTLKNTKKWFGASMMVKKLVIDVLIKLKLVYLIPKNIRWGWAHEFHYKWKLMYLDIKGEKEYNRISDELSILNLENFYETGRSFDGKIFIDVGCGIRGFLPVITALHKYGIDPVIGELPPESQGVNYFSVRGEELNELFPDDFADVIACHNMLNHVENPSKVLSNIYDVLNDDGILLLQVFIQHAGIGHTKAYLIDALDAEINCLFYPVLKKIESIPIVSGILDESIEGIPPICYGGVFKKRI